MYFIDSGAHFFNMHFYNYIKMSLHLHLCNSSLMAVLKKKRTVLNIVIKVINNFKYYNSCQYLNIEIND